MNRHAELLLANVDAETHAAKLHTTSEVSAPSSALPTRLAPRRLWGRVALETAILLGLV